MKIENLWRPTPPLPPSLPPLEIFNFVGLISVNFRNSQGCALGRPEDEGKREGVYHVWYHVLLVVVGGPALSFR